METITMTFEAARCVKINGKKVTPQAGIREANIIGGRNGIGIKHALENRIIGEGIGPCPRPRPCAC